MRAMTNRFVALLLGALVLAAPLHAAAATKAYSNNSSLQNGAADSTNTTGAVDARLQEASATTNDGAGTTIRASNPSVASSDQNSLITFDISDLPAGKQIDSATLYVNLLSTTGSNQQIDLHRVLRNWVEAQATWNIYSTGNNWGTAGGLNATDIDTTATASYTTDGTTGWKSFDVTADVADFYSGAQTNYGWLLKIAAADTVSPSVKQFGSSENGTATVRPELYVVYSDAPGLAKKVRHYQLRND